MNESLAQVVSSLGLSPEQARVYLILVDHGPQIVSELAKKAQVQRTYIYAICRQLIEMGLVKEEKQGKITRYSALSPDRLLDLVESKKTQLSQTQRTLEGILPTLKAKYAVSETKPVVTYYEGVEGVMRANMQILEEKQTILAFLVINRDIDKLMDKYWNEYYQKRFGADIHVKAITPDTPEGVAYKQRDREELRETRLVPSSQFPFAIEKNICGNKVALFSMHDKTLMATVIENKEIADTERAIFELAWNQADTYLH